MAQIFDIEVVIWSGLIFEINVCTKRTFMKPLLKKLIHFVKSEWFLLVMLGAIGLIVWLFEVLS